MVEWVYSNTVRDITCPKCKANPGEPCRRPSGGKTWPPHKERISEYSNSLSVEEFASRHTRRTIDLWR